VTTFWQSAGRWNAGAFTARLNSNETGASDIRITESGNVYARISSDTERPFYVQWSLQGAESRIPFEPDYDLELVDDADRSLTTLGHGGVAGYDSRIERNNTRIMSHTNGTLRIVQTAYDGAFIVTGASLNGQTSQPQPDPSLSRVFKADNSYTTVPDGLVPVAVAPGGTYVATTPDTPVIALFRPNANNTYARTNIPLSPAMVDQGVPGDIRVNHGGRIVVGYRMEVDEDDYSNVTYAGTVWTWVPGGAWRNITAEATPPGTASAAGIEVVDVSEWGDILVQFRETVASLSGDRVVRSGALLSSRKALTGQVSNTAASSGRAKRPASSRGPSLKNKTVTLSNGFSTMRVKTNAAGRFRILAPTGSDYTLSASGGTCLLTANGCHVSTTLPTITEHGKPVNLARTMMPNLATLLNRRGSVLPKVQAARSVKVRCRATTTCRVKIILRSGRTVYGTGTATIPKGRTKPVVIKLSRAATSRLKSVKRVQVGATLSVRADRASTSTTQSYVIAR
jgi:hypothetical protein